MIDLFLVFVLIMLGVSLLICVQVSLIRRHVVALENSAISLLRHLNDVLENIGGVVDAVPRNGSAEFFSLFEDTDCVHEKAFEEALRVNVSDMGMSTTATLLLQWAGVQTLRDLTSLSIAALEVICEGNEPELEEIYNAVEKYGFCMRPDFEPAPFAV